MQLSGGAGPTVKGWLKRRENWVGQSPIYTVYIRYFAGKLPEGVNWWNVQICDFIALRSHPLPLNPIGTIFASDWSWHYELHEDVLGFMWVTLCPNWQGLELTMATKTLIWWFCMGKQHMLAYIPYYLIVSLYFVCNDICLSQGLYNTKNHVTWNGGWPAILWWTIGFTPHAIRHICQNRQHSSSGAISYL
jgi:hypothetical protein